MTDRDLRGAELAGRFFTGVVEPLLSRGLPGLGYAAARLGSGSDVLGLDDQMSRDLHFGYLGRTRQNELTWILSVIRDCDATTRRR